jgi:hypothetical protein
MLQDKRGVSNIIVFVLGLVIVVTIVANVFLWNYEMNRLDWEKMQEDISITNVERVTSSSWLVAQSEYTVNIGSRISGTYIDTQNVNSQYETFTEASGEEGSYTPAFIGYRSDTGTQELDSPKSRLWNGSAWLTEKELADAGSAVQHVRVAYSPNQTRWYEKIVVTLSNDGYLDAYVWNGSSWLVTNNIGYVGTTVDVYRSYDIVYERVSGRAMLVYAISSSDTTKDLAYKIWNGTQWSSEAYINDPSTSNIQYYWVKLASYPLTTGRVNEIALIASEETSNDANAWIWDGSSWGNYLQLEDTVASRTRECISVEYEQLSGDAMFIWGYNNYMQSRKWTGSWGSELPQVYLGATPYWFTLKADPVSNRLMAVIVDSRRDLNTVRWDGSSWTRDSEHDSNVDTSSTRCADFEWEPSGSKGLLVWGTSSGSLSYKTFTAPSTWSGTSTITAADTHRWVQLRRNTDDVSGDIKILGGTLNNNDDLGALSWDGSTLTNEGDSAFTSDTAVTTYECFDIKFSNFRLGFELDMVSAFVIDLSTYPLTNIQTVEIQLRYRASDADEKWYLKVYNWSSSTYSDSGFNYTSGHTPTTGWDYYAVNLTDKWLSYVHTNGTIKVKILNEGPDDTQTTLDIDFLGVRVVINGTSFTFKNGGSLTSHLVSLWIINSTVHQRYDIDVFINAGDTLSYLRVDILLPSGQSTVKVVTERGNIAVYSVD